MPAINGLSVSDFASAIKVLGRSSQVSASAASERADQVPDNSRRLGQEVNNDGFVSGGEMYEFARLTGGIGQGLSAQEKRLGTATRILYQALYEAPAQNMLLYSNAPPAPWRKEVPITGMTGTVQVKDSNGKVVLETDRKKLAQRIAGAAHLPHAQRALPRQRADERAVLLEAAADHAQGLRDSGRPADAARDGAERLG
jgi:hypothetical protein